jgi:hypothetical protein
MPQEAAKLRARRDREIRRLRAENPTLTLTAIAAVVGCSRQTVHEALSDDRRAAYNERRRLYALQGRSARTA